MPASMDCLTKEQDKRSRIPTRLILGDPVISTGFLSFYGSVFTTGETLTKYPGQLRYFLFVVLCTININRTYAVGGKVGVFGRA